MLSAMSKAILQPLVPFALAIGLACATPADARTMSATIARVSTAVATLEGVAIRLDWPAGAAQGQLDLRAARVDAPDLGYRFRALHWRCPLQRDGQDGWRCDGVLQAATSKPMRLSLARATASTDAVLAQGKARLALHRDAATPDDTVLDLTRVPLAWAQALASQAWADGRLKAGTLDGKLTVRAPDEPPLRVDGVLALADGAFETLDGSIASEHLGGRFRIDYRKFPATTLASVDAELHGGAFLYGKTFVTLPRAPVQFRLDAMQRGDAGWQLPAIEWRDGDALVANGSAAFDREVNLRDLDVTLRSGDLAPLAARYLSGWFAVAGLSDMQARGALDAKIRLADGRLSAVDAQLHDVALDAPVRGFAFDGLDGDLRFSGTAAVDSRLRWRSGSLAGLPFGAAALPLRSGDGELRTRTTVRVPMLGGQVRFDDLLLRPPADDHGLRMRFGVALDALELGKLSQAFGGPAFRGTISGRIPAARYADDRLDFDGGLSIDVFDGTVAVSSLSMERPFGVAPSLSADVALRDLDLLAITEVFDFGSISGRLDGRIDGLRLVDWTPAAFDAELRTNAAQARAHGERQRISQRAVNNISSVGDASFAGSLQARLIGLFDDFGYARIGISCRLSNEVCTMGGLHSAGAGFTIVEGAGLPRLDVVGFNRRVDWPTLVERLAAVSEGDVKPVFK